MKNYFKIFVLVFFVSVAISANASEKNIELKNRITAVSNLLNKSTVSKQVLHSNVDAAVQYYMFSKSLYDDAVDAYDEGDFKESSRLIQKSRIALIDAIEFANLRGEKKKKRSKHNYELLRKSANSLMDALERVGVEKGHKDEYVYMFKGFNEKLGEADKLYFQGQYKTAITELGKILRTIKREISEMRSGDTLVRTLTFANAKEEYLYEIDRNDTHFMLIDMFLSEKDGSNKSLPIIKRVLQSSKKLRREAESLASNSNHKKAIKVLEKSTQEIINVIRNTGVFIPD